MGRVCKVVLPLLLLWIEANATSQHKSTTATTVGWFGRRRSSSCVLGSHRGGFQQATVENDLNITATDGSETEYLAREISTSMPRSSFVRHETTTSRALEMENSSFTILSDTVLYEKWRKLTSRQVRMPSGRVADFEIVGQSNGGPRLDGETAPTDQAVLIFVWHARTRTTTKIREYMPAMHAMRYGLAAGMVDAKHVAVARNTTTNSANATTMHESGVATTARVAAECELAEECRLAGGTWLQLTERPVILVYHRLDSLFGHGPASSRGRLGPARRHGRGHGNSCARDARGIAALDSGRTVHGCGHVCQSLGTGQAPRVGRNLIL
jgi:hypothetical protein